MKKSELKERLQLAIREAFNINVSIIFVGHKIHINGVSDKIDELKIYLFVIGYIYAVKSQNIDEKLRVYDPAI